MPNCRLNPPHTSLLWSRELMRVLVANQQIQSKSGDNNETQHSSWYRSRRAARFSLFAQNAPVRFRGVISSFDGTTLVVRTSEGKTTSVSVPADVRINANGKARLSDIKPGDFVGSAADKGPDGKLHAEEVHIFPEAMRGTGEGHRPMGPNRSMTNGTVAINDPESRTKTNGTVSAASARGMGSITLTVHYKDADQTIEVSQKTPVATIIPGDRTLLKPGAVVSVVAVQTDSGLTAAILTAEKNGVKPI